VSWQRKTNTEEVELRNKGMPKETGRQGLKHESGATAREGGGGGGGVK